MTLATAVQDAVIRLAADLAPRGWDLGAGLWSIHPHPDGTVSLEKGGGEGFFQGSIVDLVEALPHLHPDHAGYIVMFEVWVSPSGVFANAAEATDKVDVRYLVAGLASGVCIVLEHRADTAKFRVTFDDGRQPPVNALAPLCAHLRSKVVGPAPQEAVAAPSMPQEVAQLLEAMGLSPTVAIVFPLTPRQS